jgi:hypothetical protein
MPPIQPSDNDPLPDIFAEAREERVRYDAFWLRFARATPSSPRRPPSCQTTCRSSRRRSPCSRAATRSGPLSAARSSTSARLAPICELDGPRRPWSSSERQVLVWSAHLWDADRHQARFPYEFDRYKFRRWITAVHLRGGLAPAFWCR